MTITPQRLIWWTAAVVFLVLLVLAAMQIVRALREMKRLGTRVGEYGDLPVLNALERAEGHARRLESALAQLDPLVARARVAIAIIRRGPVPPELRTAIARFRAEAGAFRTTFSRH